MNIGRNAFEYMPNNHKAYYFAGIDVCYAYNGNHSIGAGVGLKKGVIQAKEIQITLLFDHLFTDGFHWYNRHTNEKYHELFDFRIGVLFEIAKMKNKLA